jgi:uncharacterized protein (TIGR00299 family) protein
MRVAFVDPFSGASGDMLLGALIDAGASVDELNGQLAGLGIQGASVSAERVTLRGLTGTRATVPPESDHHARAWRDVRGIIEHARIEPDARAMALQVFAALAKVEAAVHAIAPDDVEFHEIGALDTIVDVAGFAIGCSMLGIERLYSGPLRVGGGTVKTAHGQLPVPAPATAQLLADAAAPIAAPLEGEVDAGELLTPTAAAILTTQATFERPSMNVMGIGTGFGRKELPWPNMCRLVVGETSGASTRKTESLTVIETNIDDMNPQFMELLAERLFAGGALDVWTTQIGMKKGRPAVQIGALCRPADAENLSEVLIQQSTTLGVRRYVVERLAAARRVEPVETRWGTVRVKLKIWDGRVIDANPEYDDCAAIARSRDVSVRDVWSEAHRIGEAFVGRASESGDWSSTSLGRAAGGQQSAPE